MSNVAQLLIPAIRWDPATGFDAERAAITDALAIGVGGFVLYGGEQDAVRALTRELQQKSKSPLLIGADLERGAGQQFGSATGLPPLAAIASLDDQESLRRAARLTAREARTMGVNWDYAPVCDLDVLHDNPIIGTRAIPGPAARVADLASEWIDACQAEGVLACAKHFPGHGRTATDPHSGRPTVDASADTLHNEDLVPFRAVIDSGVASIMMSHVVYPALDPSGAPASQSREIVQWLLRQQLKYENLVLTDALNMRGALGDGDECEAAVLSLRAGCDLVLHVTDVRGVAAAVDAALKNRQLDPERIHQSVRRRLKWAQWASPPNDWRRPSASDTAWGAQLADRVIKPLRGNFVPVGSTIEVVVVDDDAELPGNGPSREPFLLALRAGGRQVTQVPTPGGQRTPVVIALFGDVRAGKGRVAYSEESLAAVADAVAAAERQARDAFIVQFGHPRLADSIPTSAPVVSAWAGDRCMQQAAARWVVGRK